MSLLREIQTAAISSDIDLAVLLRKCKVLSARLNNEEFKDWVDSELNGYQNVEDLPSYRTNNVNSKGNFSGPFGSGLNNADIPLLCIPKEFREDLSILHLRDPVASLEALAAKSDGSSARIPWNPDLVALVGQGIYEGMNCMQAWKVIPVSIVISAIDAVRNKVLGFVLEIEAEAPDAGEAEINSNPVPQEKIQQIFQTYISGNVQNVATGSTDFKQEAVIHNAASPEVFAQLKEAIEAIRKEPGYDIIEDSIIEMEASFDTDTFKSKYNKFMSVLADHMQVLGPVVAPYLVALAALVP